MYSELSLVFVADFLFNWYVLLLFSLPELSSDCVLSKELNSALAPQKSPLGPTDLGHSVHPTLYYSAFHMA